MYGDNPPTTRRRMILGTSGIVATAFAGCIGDNGTQNDQQADDHSQDDYGHDQGYAVAEEPFDEIGIGEFSILDRAHDPHEEAAYVHGDHWHGNLPNVPLNDNISLGAYVEDDDGNGITLGDDFELRVDVAHGADDSVASFDYHGDHVHIIGEQEGITEVVFLLWHDDHADYQSPAITVQVSEDDHDHDDDHQHAEMEINRFDIIDRSTDEVTAELHDDHWDGELPTVPVDDNISLGAIIEDGHGDEIHLGDDLEFRVRLNDGADDIVTFDYHGDHVHIIGQEEGDTAVVFQLWHDDHADFETVAINVTVEEIYEQD